MTFRLHNLLFIVLVVCGFGAVADAEATTSTQEAHSDCGDCDDCPDEGDCGDECSTCHCCPTSLPLSMTTTTCAGLSAPISTAEAGLPEFHGRPATGISPAVFKPPRFDSRPF